VALSEYISGATAYKSLLRLEKNSVISCDLNNSMWNFTELLVSNISLTGYGNIFFYYFILKNFYRFCVTLLFLEIFEPKKSQISESFPPSWILADMHVTPNESPGNEVVMWHKQGHAIILSIEQLVIMSPKSYTSVTIWNKKLSDDFFKQDLMLFGHLDVGVIWLTLLMTSLKSPQ
jgi:hypothetical protein